MKVAVFDLDGTILCGTTAERQLASFLTGMGIIGTLQFARFGLECVRLIVTGRAPELRTNKRYLAHLEKEKILSLIPELCETRLRPRFSKPVVSRLHQLKEEGYHVVLLSGAPVIILEHLQHFLPIDHCIGTELEERNRKFTGRIKGMYPYSVGKREAFEKHYSSDSLDYPDSYAFADRYSDLPLLELFGHPVAVHPDKHLSYYAQEKKWEIIVASHL